MNFLPPSSVLFFVVPFSKIAVPWFLSSDGINAGRQGGREAGLFFAQGLLSEFFFLADFGL